MSVWAIVRVIVKCWYDCMVYWGGWGCWRLCGNVGCCVWPVVRVCVCVCVVLRVWMALMATVSVCGVCGSV